MPALGPSEGDVNEKLEKTEEEIGQTEAVEKKGEMLQEEVIDVPKGGGNALATG